MSDSEYSVIKCDVIKRFDCIDVSDKSTRGDQKVRGKVLLNRIAFIDFNRNS